MSELACLFLGYFLLSTKSVRYEKFTFVFVYCLQENQICFHSCFLFFNRIFSLFSLCNCIVLYKAVCEYFFFRLRSTAVRVILQAQTHCLIDCLADSCLELAMHFPTQTRENYFCSIFDYRYVRSYARFGFRTC